jgi:hypothetical protein
MAFQTSEHTSTPNAEETRLVTQHLVTHKLPFHQPQIGPLRHILQETGEGGNSKEYDSYRDNRR